MTILVNGCGGGSTPPNLMSAPGATALEGFYQSSHSTNVNLQLDRVYATNDTLALSSTTTTFNKQVVRNAMVTADTGIVGDPSSGGSGASGIVYYNLGPFAPVGSVGSNGFLYSVVTSYNPLPMMLTVGQQGPFATFDIYHDATMAVFDGTQTSTYSVVADSPTSVRLCVRSTFTGVANNPDQVGPGFFEYCYRVDSSGSAALDYMFNGSGIGTGFYGPLPFP